MTVGLVQPTARRIGCSGRCSSACGGKLTARDYVNAAARSRSPQYHAYVGVPDSPKSTHGDRHSRRHCEDTLHLLPTCCLRARSDKTAGGTSAEMAHLPWTFTGGDERTRTADPLLAKQVLYQLSYVPLFACGDSDPRRCTRLRQRITSQHLTNRAEMRDADMSVSTGQSVGDVRPRFISA
jgi:hypothetical protein